MVHDPRQAAENGAAADHHPVERVAVVRLRRDHQRRRRHAQRPGRPVLGPAASVHLSRARRRVRLRIPVQRRRRLQRRRQARPRHRLSLQYQGIAQGSHLSRNHYHLLLIQNSNIKIFKKVKYLFHI